MVLVQKQPFFHFFFQAVQARKMCFTIFQNQKTAFHRVDLRFWSKNGHFFNFFFFKAIQPGKKSFTILQNQKTPFQAIKTQSSKSRKIDIFPKGLTHGFGPKMAIFPTFFLGNIAQENVFYDILEPKNTFLGYINTKFKMSKNCHYYKRVNPWFWYKNGHFFTLFFQAVQARQMCFTIFQKQKIPFQAIKTQSSKRRIIDIFPKGLTHVYGPKMAIFQTFFFRQYRPRKCILRYSRTKRHLSRL